MKNLHKSKEMGDYQLEENNGLNANNKYLLTMMVAKRAKQLNQGFKPLLDIDAKSNRMLALKEIQEGKVYIKKEDDDQKTEGNQA